MIFSSSWAHRIEITSRSSPCSQVGDNWVLANRMCVAIKPPTQPSLLFLSTPWRSWRSRVSDESIRCGTRKTASISYYSWPLNYMQFSWRPHGFLNTWAHLYTPVPEHPVQLCCDVMMYTTVGWTRYQWRTKSSVLACKWPIALNSHTEVFLPALPPSLGERAEVGNFTQRPA